MKKIKDFFNKILFFINRNDEYFIFLLSLIFITFSITLFFLKNDTLLYQDSRSHLNIARRLIDNLTPGVAQIGGTWLPLFQILELPFIWINSLWNNGLSGSIVAGFATVGAAQFMYILFKDINKSKSISFLGYVTYILNPNLLYISSVPMTESLLLFTAIGSVFYLYKWAKNNRLSNLIFSAFFVFLGTWVRYDAWFLVCIELIFIIAWSFVKHKKIIESYLIIFGFLGFLGICLWVVWNTLIWGQPLYFLLGEHSAHAQQITYVSSGRLITNHNAILSLVTYFWASSLNIGFIPVIVSIFLFILLIIKNKQKAIILPSSLFLSLIIFNILSLYLGISVIFVPQINPQEALFNVRYGLMALPFTVLTIFITFRNKFFVIIIFLLIIGGYAYMIRMNKVVIFNDGVNGISSLPTRGIVLAKWFKKNYDGGLILVSVSSRDPIVQAIGLPMKLYVHEGTNQYWHSSLKNPSSMVRWIIMGKGDILYKSFIKTSNLKKFENVYESSDTIIYKCNECINRTK